MRPDQYVVLGFLALCALGMAAWWIRMTVEGRQRQREMEQMGELNREWAVAFGRWLASGEDRRTDG